jgi:endonuclease-3 related protein
MGQERYNADPKCRSNLIKIYQELYKFFGHQSWWPGETRFEIIIGAILTQSVSWKNVERAIGNLKKHDLLSYEKLVRVNEKKLAELIKPTMYYNQKAKKIKNFIAFVQDNYKGNINNMETEEPDSLRYKLLKVNGIGKETADSIILYAYNKPIFVIDAYTKRIFSRLKLIKENAEYEDVQNFFMQNLPHNYKLFNDYHAQIVKLGKDFCNKKPKCLTCPLYKSFCEGNFHLNLKKRKIDTY